MENVHRYISLAHAARRSLYTKHYLNILVLRKKLRAVKIENAWFTTEAWLQDYLDSERKVGRPHKAPHRNSQTTLSHTPSVPEPPGHQDQENPVHGSIIERLLAARPVTASVIAIAALTLIISPTVRAGVTWTLEPLTHGVAHGVLEGVQGIVQGVTQGVQGIVSGVAHGAAESYGRAEHALRGHLTSLATTARSELAEHLIAPLSDFTAGIGQRASTLVAAIAGDRTIAGPGTATLAQQREHSDPPPAPRALSPPSHGVNVTHVREVVERKEIVSPADTKALEARLTITDAELKATQRNFTLVKTGLDRGLSILGDLTSDIQALADELTALKAQTLATPASPAIREVIRETVVHLATPPGAALGNKEITASLESGAIAPTTITIGSMTFGGSTLASLQTINSSPTITGTLTISGTGTSTIASSLQVASYLTAGNLLTVPYLTATSTTATSTLATGGLAIGTNQFVVQQSSGRVGIGTTSPYARLSIVGPAVAEYFHATSTTATSTFTGQLLVNHTPETPHTFGVWSTGTGNSGLPDAALLINPPSAASDSNLLAIGVAGAVRFLIDAEGDVFANALTTVGGTTLASTTASTFTVENSLIAGDAANADAHTFRGTISHYATSSSAALTLWNSGSGDLLTLQGDTPAPVTRLTVTNAGNVGLGTTSPGSLLALQGIANFAPANSFLFSPLTLPSFTATSTTATSTIAGGLTTAGLASSNGLTLTGGSLLQTNTATSSLAGGLSLTHLAASNGLTITGGILNSTVAATSSMAGGLSLTHLAASNGITVTGGILRSTATATSTFDAGIATAGLSSSNGLTVTGGNLLLTVPETNTAAATSTWSGGISTAGLSSSDGLTLTGGIFNSTVAATSSMAGGLSLTNLAASNGITVTGGILRSTVTATSTLDGGLRLSTLTAGSVLFAGVSGALQENNANLYWDNANGNLGLSTTTPSQLLSVHGNALISGTAFIGGALTSTSTLTIPTFVANSTTATSTIAGGLAIETSGFVYDYQTNNVGIGTTGPGEILDLFATAPSLKFTTSANSVRFRYITADGNQRLSFIGGGLTELVTFQNGGNVGIGTTGPGYLTHIRKASDSDYTANNIATYNVPLGISNPTSGASNNTFISLLAEANAEAHLGIVTDSDNNGGDFVISMYNPSVSNRAEMLRILNNGNVGIGTTGPEQQLHLHKTGATPILKMYSERSADSAVMENRILFGGTTNTGWGTPDGAGIDFRVNSPTESTSGQLRLWAYPQTTSSPTMSLVGGNVGIGTTNPVEIFSITSSGATPKIRFDATGVNQPIELFMQHYSSVGSAYGASRIISYSNETVDGASTELAFNIRKETASVGTDTEVIRINKLGRVGIATTSPWRTLSVTGTLGLSSSLTAESGSDNYLCIDPATYEVTDGGANCGASSLRYKKDIASLDYGLDAVLKLNPVSFYWNEAAGRPHDLTRHLGFIAEEVYELIPEVVTLNASSTPESIEYDKLTAILAKAIQDLNAKVQTLTAQNGTINSSSSFTSSSALTVASIQSASGAWSLDESGHLVVKKITAEEGTFERLQSKTGITLYDPLGEPYCVRLQLGGSLTSTPGACSPTTSEGSPSQVDQQTVDTSPSPSPSPTQESTPTPEPSPTEPENPAPAATPSEE